MNYYQQLNRVLEKIPETVKRFLLRVIVLFASWKMLYLFLLVPAEVPDAWLVKKLGNGTAFVLNKVYNTAEFDATAVTRVKTYGNDVVHVTCSVIRKAGKKLIGIYQACNGLELMILYAGFIVAFSGGWKLKFLFISGGVLGLYFLNVLRLVLLGYICIAYPAHFQFAHKYLFNLVVYAFTFFAWMWYVSASRVHPVKKANSI